jgi:predicted nucleic acid-binding Zn ribbon protein
MAKRKRKNPLNAGQRALSRERYQLNRFADLDKDPIQDLTFADLLPQVVAKAGLGRDLFLHQLAQEWTELVGEMNAAHSKPGKFEYGVLCILVDHPIFLMQMQQMASLIKDKLKAAFPDKKIRNVRFQIEAEG